MNTQSVLLRDLESTATGWVATGPEPSLKVSITMWMILKARLLFRMWNPHKCIGALTLRKAFKLKANDVHWAVWTGEAKINNEWTLYTTEENVDMMSIWKPRTVTLKVTPRTAETTTMDSPVTS